MLNWTPEQSARYTELRAKVRELDWKSTAEQCFPSGSVDPALSEKDLEEVEKKLDCEIPEDLRELYLEVGAIFDDTRASVVQGIDYTLDDCKDFWGSNYDETFMDMRSMFPFGGDGGGDRFFIPISASGLYLDTGIYRWDHENDSRTWYSNSIKDLLVRYVVERM